MIVDSGLENTSRVCRTNQISDLPGVGTVWFYPDGVANILSQNQLVVDRKEKNNCSTDQYYQTKNVLGLSCHYMTSKGRNVTFLPTPEELHVIDCSEYFKEGKDVCVFGVEVTTNNTNFGENMGICNTSDGKLNTSDDDDDQPGSYMNEDSLLDNASEEKNHEITAQAIYFNQQSRPGLVDHTNVKNNNDD